MKKTVADTNLISEWNFERNSELGFDPSNIAEWSHKKVWWQCSKGHVYDSTVASRSNGSGCSYCSGKKTTPETSLAAINPLLSLEWHPTKNGSLTPENFMPRSSKKAWWVCEKGHEWDSVIANRSKGVGCPYCAGKKATRETSLTAMFPKIASEWHPTKNHNLTPHDVTPGSGKKVWWTCGKHNWKTHVSSRTKGHGCPQCTMQVSRSELRVFTEIKTIFTEAVIGFKINGKECDIYIPNLKFGIEFDGVYWHRNKRRKDLSKNIHLAEHGVTLVRIREKGLSKLSEYDVIYDYDLYGLKVAIDSLLDSMTRLYELPVDVVNKINEYHSGDDFVNNKEYLQFMDRLPGPISGNSLAEVHQELSNQWHPNKNGNMTPENVSASSGQKAWWICDKGHEWDSVIANRSKGVGCPYCTGQKVTMENSLAHVNPETAKLWHPTKNADLTPDNVTVNSSKRVWWRCEKGHEFDGKVNNRVRSKGCPYCLNKKLSEDNSLAARFPELAKEWHPTKNGALESADVMPGNNKKAWWKCINGHEWEAQILSRSSSARNCPYCTNQRASNTNNLEFLFPDVANEWDFEKNDKKPSDILPGSDKKYWWICKNGHSWSAGVGDRTRGRGCPGCAGLIMR